MRHAIDPTVDVVFKAILGSQHHVNLPIHFINSILELQGEERIQTLEIRNPFSLQDYMSSKVSIVDVKATDQKNRDFQIEIQVSTHEALLERMLYNWVGLYQAKIKKGDTYMELEPVFSIWLLVDNLPPMPTHLPGFPQRDQAADAEVGRKIQTDLVHVPFGVYSPVAGCFLTDHFGIHVIQLKKHGRNAKITSDKDRWVHFFNIGKELDPSNLPMEMDTIEMREAMSIVETFSEQEECYHVYISRLDKQRTEQTRQVALDRALKQAAYERAEKERERAEKERERAEKQEALKREERERAEKERERAEKERLVALLKKAGINPDQLE